MLAELEKQKSRPVYTSQQKGEYTVREKASRKTLGLDLGTNSIGWTHVSENENRSWKIGTIDILTIQKKVEPDFIKAIHTRIDQLAKIEEDWDHEGGLKPKPENIEAAKFFLEVYGKAMYDRNGIWLPIPEVDPVNNGSIDISWWTDTARILINIRQKDNEPFAFFYGDLYKNKFQIKGNVPVKTDAFPHILEWMKYLNR
jgi:23S rRNA U2552 (ribose-2'-O)-methylase RlmE/FtsJ